MHEAEQEPGNHDPCFLSRDEQQALVKQLKPAKGPRTARGRGSSHKHVAMDNDADEQNDDHDNADDDEREEAKPMRGRPRGKTAAAAKAKTRGKDKTAAKAKGKAKAAAKAQASGKAKAAAKAKGKPKKQADNKNMRDQTPEEKVQALKRPSAATAARSAKPNRVPVHNFYKRSTLDVYWSRTAVGLKLRGTMQQAGQVILNAPSVFCPTPCVYTGLLLGCARRRHAAAAHCDVCCGCLAWTFSSV